MIKTILPFFSIMMLLPNAVYAQLASSNFGVQLKAFENNGRIPDKYAYCMPDGKGQTQDGGNINPAISWYSAPNTTRSYAIIVIDPDVPATFDLANQPGKSIRADYPRQNFYHWVLIDIPTTVENIAEGQNSQGITRGGKPYGTTIYGINGQNDFQKMSPGPHGGYDGPCPPWNDELLHHYHYIVYALNTSSLNLQAPFNGKQLEAAMAGHIVAQAEKVGTYTTNPKLMPAGFKSPLVTPAIPLNDSLSKHQ